MKDCDKRVIMPIYPRRVKGILKIHARCKPARCARKRTALAFQRNQPFWEAATCR